MEKTPTGTPVGVDDPYAMAGVCERCTSEGKCRYALDPGGDEAFTAERAADGYRCPAADPEGAWEWPDCPHYRDTTDGKECARCGLEERRDAHGDGRPLIEEHHLRYRAEGEEREHEITVGLCRWCHAKVHGSWARIDDDASPDPEAIAAREERRSAERSEFGFESARERRDDGD